MILRQKHCKEDNQRMFNLAYCQKCHCCQVCQADHYLAMCGSRRGDRGFGHPHPLKNHNNIGFLSDIDPIFLKKFNCAKPAFNVGPSPARQRHAGGPIIAHLKWYLDPLSLHQVKKRCQSWTPSDETLWIRACLAIFFSGPNPEKVFS